MSDIVRIGESIEGLSVDGNSRDPLLYRGIFRYKDRYCHRFIASFNIKSKIVSQITDEMLKSKKVIKIEENACCDLSDELICDKAIIHSLDKKYSSTLKSNISATHSASSWHFPKQTNVKIDRSHQEILNAISNSELNFLVKNL